MFQALEIITLLLVAFAMAPSVAHALELPGKLRLGRDAYVTVQPIYYPGFTAVGAAEPLAILATLILLIAIPGGTPAFFLTLVALVALVVMHAAYWLATHPVNKFWLAGEDLSSFSAGFFSFGSGGNDKQPPDWTALRDRWEYSHVVRAGLAIGAFVLLVIAVTLPG